MHNNRCPRATLASVLIASAPCLSGCGGGADGGTSNSISRAIAPCQTVTLTAGETVLVPAGTTVFDPARNNTVHIAGDHNTVNTPAGSQVIVPSIATGTPDNTVIAR
jgi:hypothetical protein